MIALLVIWATVFVGILGGVALGLSQYGPFARLVVHHDDSGRTVRGFTAAAIVFVLAALWPITLLLALAGGFSVSRNDDDDP